MSGKIAEEFFIFPENSRILLWSATVSEILAVKCGLNTLCQSDPLEFADGCGNDRCVGTASGPLARR
jgi:hypothetical protein